MIKDHPIFLESIRFIRSNLIKKIISKYFSTFELVQKSDFKSFILKRPIYTSAIAFIGLFIVGTSLGILTQRKPSGNNDLDKISKSESAKPKLEKVIGKSSKAEAKIAGITPAVFIFKGK